MTDLVYFISGLADLVYFILGLTGKYFIRLWRRYTKEWRNEARRKRKIVSKATAAGQLPLWYIFLYYNFLFTVFNIR